VLARAATQEWDWARGWTAALVRLLLPLADNRALIEGWVGEWLPFAIEASRALAPDHACGADAVLAEAGLLDGGAGAADVEAVLRRPSARRRSRSAASPPAPRAPSGDGTGDLVGIVMAKSAEGDAVASVLGRREEIEVLEQPSFWEIRAHGRLTISYAEISARVGYEIDAYSIQHEMSTHYGRMIATDDALMLFSDPTEAMEHLRS